MSIHTPITIDEIELVSKSFFSNDAHRIAKNAVTSQGVERVSKVPEAIALMSHSFDIEVRQGKPTNQRQSGRCWIFAALNMMRTSVMDKYNLDNFEFSQAYCLYFDKLEKANWFLWNVIDTIEEPLDGRLMSFLLKDPVNDGGQWDMFKALVIKYGVVPKETMPETSCSEATHDMNSYLARYLRLCAKEIRKESSNGADLKRLERMRRSMLVNVQYMLTTCLGQPPHKFDVRLKDKDGIVALSGIYSPKAFLAETMGTSLDDFVSIVSAPTPDKPFDHVYVIDRLGNVVESDGVRYLNLKPAELKRMAIAQLKDGLPVWFGCDIAQSYLDEDGIMGLDTLDIDGLFGFSIMNGFGKADRLQYGESLMTHAMTIVGVNFNSSGMPTEWKIENSWGNEHDKDGYELMSDGWFDEYVYQVVVKKQYLTQSQLDVYNNGELVHLAPWDPLGALAW